MATGYLCTPEVVDHAAAYKHVPLMARDLAGAVAQLRAMAARY